MEKGLARFFKQLTVFFTLSTLTLSLAACSTEGNYAPVTEVASIEPLPTTGIYRVKAGETIYEIAWRYGLDYRDLAARNHLSPPYLMRAGQVIYLNNLVRARHNRQMNEAQNRVVTHRNPPRLVTTSLKTSNTYQQSSVVTTVSQTRSMPAPSGSQFLLEGVGPVRWSIPASGRIKPFSSSHKGINILGQVGQPVNAAASGKVVYSGNGLRGYGNLIIIKHNGLFLSAYAYNKMNFVKEGDWVWKGQKIAEMGVGESGSPMLHFEIRRAGKPVDPAFYLNQS